ncbi:MAG TPA: MBOAT family O-acyltransferase [Planctomycetota bacterium]|jgi:D-alanyl-lipoteichoic acid acyltransferase DltB (MBOAT superfamily)|nr:membrane-bound O-acyltransferase family protein [Planctomycetota bacterium]MDP7245880.1 MBOAT family O-acyltransferase [Planctomycetota bacterium]HJM39102.1 MBOAT family O-acyltransferase [Planctomycetota bacterium]|tara:strand:- start:18027 stop:19562 length:1536 start_codon:yes stop_codon:yes gene_type:complete
MLFNSPAFIFLFLPIVLLGFFSLGKRGFQKSAVTWLVFSSLFFYGWWNPAYLWLLIFSILFNFFLGIALERRRKKAILVAGVAVNLGLLGYFKYADFFILNANAMFDLDVGGQKILLPLAISFFTFQQIAYIVDVYRGEVKERNFLHYALFVTFFPQLISGPIVHHAEMLPQFARKESYKFRLSNLNFGLTTFAAGLFKKVVLADGISEYSTPVFEAADAGQLVTFFDGWGGLIAYSMQIYFDFSGYADMAIGIGAMFGIALPLNFNSPYRSRNIIQFWRCWHMTLSRFLKDYLYIPLGGNRKGSRYLNLFITMLLGGLWHGAAWNFVIWGALHGAYLMLNHFWKHFSLKSKPKTLPKPSMLRAIFSTALTFLAVSFAWAFFRAETFAGALSLTKAILGQNGLMLPAVSQGFLPEFFQNSFSFFEGGGVLSFPSGWGFAWLLVLGGVIFFLPNTQEFITRERFTEEKEALAKGRASWTTSCLPAIVVGFVLFVSIKIMVSVSESEFLYFNF